MKSLGEGLCSPSAFRSSSYQYYYCCFCCCCCCCCRRCCCICLMLYLNELTGDDASLLQRLFLLIGSASVPLLSSCFSILTAVLCRPCFVYRHITVIWQALFGQINVLGWIFCSWNCDFAHRWTQICSDYIYFNGAVGMRSACVTCELVHQPSKIKNESTAY